MNQITNFKDLINKLPPEIQTIVINTLEFGQPEPKVVKENGFKKFDHRPEKPEFISKPQQKEDMIVPHFSILLELAKNKGRPIKPIINRFTELRTDSKFCRKCFAPQEYLRNHGFYKRKSTGELFPKHTCKVCEAEYAPGSQRKQTKHMCRFCGYAMDPKRKYSSFTVYYCKKKDCPHRSLQKEHKVYCERDWHLQYEEINTEAEFIKKKHKNKLRMDMRLLDLEMLFYVEMGASLQETTRAISRIFGTKTRLTSRQTVLNHAKKLATYLSKNEHLFPTALSDKVVEDETYLRYEGKWGYLFRAINPDNKNIIAEYFSRHRDSESCIKLNKIVCEKYLKQMRDPEFCLITDQAPIYNVMVDYMKQKNIAEIDHKALKGIFDEPDEENTVYRPEKQMIERSFGTLKSYTKRRRGFTTFEGTEIFTTLHRFFYNHLRPHESQSQVPVPLLLKSGMQVYNWSSMLQYINEK